MAYGNLIRRPQVSRTGLLLFPGEWNVRFPLDGGGGGGGTVFTYFRPGGTDTYLRPDGASHYFRP